MTKILAIDDNNDNLISLKAIVNDAFPDSIIYTALCGTKGIDLAIAENPDVILLDIVMPDMDGYEICQHLKQDKRACDIPVVFITALKGGKEDRIKALDAGADAFLSKPIDETELTLQIKAMVKIKVANEQKRDEKVRLKRLVTERTNKLELSQIATLNLLDELKAENEARKKTEEALKESEQKYRFLVDNTADTITLLDLNLNYTYISPSVFKLRGFTVEEAMAQNLRDNTTPESLNNALSLLQEEMGLEATGNAAPDRIRSIELEQYCKDGSVIWTENSIKYVRDDAGKITGILAISKDITERKLAEEKMRESQALYHSFVENMPAGVFRQDSEGRYIFVNTVFCQLKGMKADEILGKTPQELSEYESMLMTASHPKIMNNKPSMVNHKENHHELIMRTGIPIETEEVYPNPYGSNQYMQVVKSPVFSSNGRVIGTQGIQFDITEKKETEIELIAAKEKAEENDRLKSAFLANMSHEIRTPLNSIIGFSELLLDPGFKTEQQHQFAQMINDNGNNLLAIITDIMDLSKIEAGQVHVKKRQLSVNHLIAGIQNEYSYKAIEKGIELRLDPSNPKEEVLIESDETKLRQVLINFVGNALKFTKDGFIEIGVKTTADSVQFHVKDTGIGIPAEFHKQVFERFRQVETSDTRNYGGNGLGLAISKGLTELLGGTIWMESVEGLGSTFYFTVPK